MVEAVIQKITYVGGIPLDLTSLEKSGKEDIEVKGKSGASIVIALGYLQTNPVTRPIHELEIYQKDGIGNLIVDWKESDRGKANSIRFDIYTRNPATGKRARDFYAGRLIDAAMEFMSSRHPIDRIGFTWLANQMTHKKRVYPSSNYALYQLEKSRLFDLFLQQDLNPQVAMHRAMVQAALNTWTGQRIAQRYGFSVVEEITEENDIRGFFCKPNDT